MLKCAIISNYITSNVKRIMEELEARGIDYTILRPEKIVLLGKQISEVDFVINTLQNEEIPPFINDSVRVFNPYTVVKTCRDKWLTYNALLQHDIPQPFTSENREDFAEFPFVVKDRKSSLGLRCYLVNNEEELLEAESKMKAPAIYQEFISTSFGICLKAMVIGGEVICCVHKTADGFISNMSYGCNTIPYQLNEEQKELCKKAAQALNADYCGIDILFGENGKPILCEVNSNAIVKNIERVTGVNVIGAYIDYVLKEISDEQ